MEIERISLEPLVRLPHLTWDKFYYNFVEDCKERDRIVSIHDVLFGLLRLEAEITAARMASLLSVCENADCNGSQGALRRFHFGHLARVLRRLHSEDLSFLLEEFSYHFRPWH